MTDERIPLSSTFAVMDLGTNTFHLLIAERSPTGFKELVHEQIAVKLGEGGINKGFIYTEAYQRGIAAMQQFSRLLNETGPEKVRAIATSALRNASNGSDFINEVKHETGIEIEIIDGETEAGYIYKGIRSAGCLSSKKSLVVDIGGGSVEFIICNDSQIFWKQSFEIGAARLMDRFHRSDPIPPESITSLTFYLDSCLKDLFKAASDYQLSNMIGSSGVFESYAEIIAGAEEGKSHLKRIKNYIFNKEELLALIEKIVLSDHQQRVAVKGIIPVRIDMIVVASLLTRYIINKLNIGEIAMSTYSLKEGVLAEMMKG